MHIETERGRDRELEISIGCDQILREEVTKVDANQSLADVWAETAKATLIAAFQL